MQHARHSPQLSSELVVEARSRDGADRIRKECGCEFSYREVQYLSRTMIVDTCLMRARTTDDQCPFNFNEHCQGTQRAQHNTYRYHRQQPVSVPNARVGNGTHAAAAPKISCLFARVNKLNTAEKAKVKANMIPIHIAVALPEKVPPVCVARW